MAAGLTPISSSASSTAIWARPRAPPPPSARAKLFMPPLLSSSAGAFCCCAALWPPCRRDVGLGKIVALEEELRAARFREGVGEAVRQIELRLVTAFAICKKAADGERSLIVHHFDNLAAGPCDCSLGCFSRSTARQPMSWRQKPSGQRMRETAS